MDKLGTIETEQIQDMAEAVVAKYGGYPGNGIEVQSTSRSFSKRVRVYDHGRLVFAAERWKDGDQIVTKYRRGDWYTRLASVA